MRWLWGFISVTFLAGCAAGPALVDPEPLPRPATSSSRPVTLPTASTPAPTPGQAYVIRPGDNLWQISKAAYGDGTKYERILAANPGLDSSRLKPGQKIVIPLP